jgi:hypothetical protein
LHSGPRAEEGRAVPDHRWFLPGLATLIVAGSLAAHAAALPTGWEAPADLVGAGPAAGSPSVAGNARGDLAVAWIAVTPGGRRRAQFAVRTAGATSWSRVLGVGPVTDRADGIALALAPDGRLVVAWKTAARATPRRVVTRAALVSADSRRRAVRVLGRSDGRFPSFVAPPAAAFTATGRAAVAWISPGPAGAGRALVAVAPRSGVFGIPRRLDRGGDRGAPGVCPDESAVRLSARPRGGLVA